MQKLNILAISLILLITLLACSYKPNNEKIIGEWYYAKYIWGNGKIIDRESLGKYLDENKIDMLHSKISGNRNGTKQQEEIASIASLMLYAILFDQNSKEKFKVIVDQDSLYCAYSSKGEQFDTLHMKFRYILNANNLKLYYPFQADFKAYKDRNIETNWAVKKLTNDSMIINNDKVGSSQINIVMVRGKSE